MTVEPVEGGRQFSWTALRESADARRLFSCLAAALIVALMTGPSGSVTSPTHGFTASWFSPRVVVFLALGAGLWAVMTVWTRDSLEVRTNVRAAVQVSSGVFARREVRYPSYAGVLVLAIVIPPLLSTFWQQVSVDEIGIYVLLSLGLNVVIGYAGLLDLGYVAFYAIGAYVSAYFTNSLPVHPPFVLNTFWTFPLAVVAAIISGVILGLPTLRLRGDYLAIVTLGFGLIIARVADNLTTITGGPQGVTTPHFSIHFAGINYKWTLSQLPYYYLVLALIVLVIVASALLENSRVGRAWLAIREDEVAAQACGINTLKFKVMAFAIGASTSGLAGVVFAGKNNFFNPEVFSFQISILILVLVIFGGMGSLPGVVIGATLLQWLPQALRDHIEQQDLFIYFGGLLVVMMIFRPQGLVPSRRRAREFGMAEAGIGHADAMGAPGAAP